MYLGQCRCQDPSTEINLGGTQATKINNKKIARSQAKAVIIGDSLVANLSRYAEVWNSNLKPLNVVNCGIGGDGTENVLWRVDKMFLPASVYVGVFLCGTNHKLLYHLTLLIRHQHHQPVHLL